MFASIGNVREEKWIVGRFLANTPTGPWQELPPVIFTNITGPQLCAPAVTYEEKNGQPLWTMYIQTCCFAEDGVIVKATSTDGSTFNGEPQPLVTKHTADTTHPVVGVYDVGISEISLEQEPILCLLYSGYRKVGNGDLYMTYRKKFAPEDAWTRGKLILAQEAVPFHNHPSQSDYEWGLEGAKLVQLGDTFLLIGVCFQPGRQFGNRQRVFFAGAISIEGPFIPLCTPFRPQNPNLNLGENGHPDTLIIKNDLWIVFQERQDAGSYWHLRAARFDLRQLGSYVKTGITINPPQPAHASAQYASA
jgi:hypothetical protein